MAPGEAGGQPTLAGLTVPDGVEADASPAPADGVQDPVAQVAVDSHLAHLDRLFEYAVPSELDDRARPGVRVRVRFAGRLVDGFIVARTAQAEHLGRLAPLHKIVSDEVVLTPELTRLCREVADHYAGTFADVLRLAIPPRHARAEKTLPTARPPAWVPPDGSTARPGTAARGWEPYPAGPALIRRLAAGESPRAAWLAAPDAGSGDGWPTALASAVCAVREGGRGSIVVLPDHRDIDRLAQALDAVIGPDAYVRLTADLGPEQRYRAWLQVLRGHVQVVVGSRSAAFAPVERLGLVAWWDDGDDNLQEPRAPYPHVREVLRRRATLTGAALVVGGYTRSVAIQQWVVRGDLPEVRASAARARGPRVTVAGEGHHAARDAAAASARMPSVAWRAVKDGLLHGPVLVQVPRRGYLTGLRCEHCRTPVRCAACAGPLQVAAAGASAACGWCGRPDVGRPCRECGTTSRRSRVIGEARTAEEVGRSFPGARVIVSRAGQVLAAVSDQPAVVVATPGAEPVAEAGYRAVLLLDGWALLDRGGLDSGVEAVRRWSAAAALARPGAPVILTGVPPHAGLAPIEALVRWDPTWLATRDLEERTALGLPPARRTATVTGDPGAVSSAAQALADGGGGRVEVLGPLPVATGSEGQTERQRLVVRELIVGEGPGALPHALRELRAARSLRKASGDLEVRLDPVDLEL